MLHREMKTVKMSCYKMLLLTNSPTAAPNRLTDWQIDWQNIAIKQTIDNINRLNQKREMEWWRAQEVGEKMNKKGKQTTAMFAEITTHLWN